MTTQVDQATAKLIKHVLAKKQPDEIPSILCRRNFPYQLKSPQWDPTWEGLKKMERGGKYVFEIDPTFNLKINEDGTCYIHDTANNRKRLDRISKERIEKRIVKKHNPVDGGFYDEEVVVIHRPEYERLTEPKENISDESVMQIANAVAAILGSRNGHEPKEVQVPQTGQLAQTGQESPAAAPRRGRPKKVVPGPA